MPSADETKQVHADVDAIMNAATLIVAFKYGVDEATARLKGHVDAANKLRQERNEPPKFLKAETLIEVGQTLSAAAAHIRDIIATTMEKPNGKNPR